MIANDKFKLALGWCIALFSVAFFRTGTAAEDPGKPDWKVLKIEHIVPQEGADKADYPGLSGPNTTFVEVHTTPSPGYQLVNLPPPNPVISRVRIGSFDPRVAWEIFPNRSTLSRATAGVRPGERMNVVIDGRYAPITPGTGEPPPWTTISLDIDLDGDTDRDGRDNLLGFGTSKAKQIAEAKEDTNEENSPGMIIPLDLNPETTDHPLAYENVVIRKILSGQPIGTVTIKQETVLVNGQEGGKAIIRFFGQTVPETKDLFEFARIDDLWLQVTGIQPGPLKLTVTYETTNKNVTGTIVVTDTVYATVVGCKINYAPKVAAADAGADTPLYFTIKGLSAAIIVNVSVQFKAGGITFPTWTTGSAVAAGDVVKHNGNGKNNGECNDYSVLIPPALFRAKELPNGSVTSTAAYSLVVDFKVNQKDARTFTAGSNEQPILKFFDKTLEVVELGTQEKIWPLKGQTKQPSIANRTGTPVLKLLRGRSLAEAVDPNYYNDSLLPTGEHDSWSLPESPITTPAYFDGTPFDSSLKYKFSTCTDDKYNRSWPEGVRESLRHVTENTQGYNIIAQIVLQGPNNRSDLLNRQYNSAFLGQVCGIYFCIYYARKGGPNYRDKQKITDFAGQNHEVVDIRYDVQNVTFDVFPNSNFHFNVSQANSATFATLADSALTIIGVGIALMADPEPFSKLTLAATLVQTTQAVISVLSATPEETRNTWAYAQVLARYWEVDPDNTGSAIAISIPEPGGKGNTAYTLSANGEKRLTGEMNAQMSPALFSTCYVTEWGSVSAADSTTLGGNRVTAELAFTYGVRGKEQVTGNGTDPEQGLVTAVANSQASSGDDQVNMGILP